MIYLRHWQKPSAYALNKKKENIKKHFDELYFYIIRGLSAPNKIMFLNCTSDSYWKTINLIKNDKIKTLINTLNSTTNILKDVLEEYYEMEKMVENLKSNPQKTNSNNCQYCGELQQHVIKKEELIQTTASKLSIINHTQDYKSIEEIIMLLNKETNTLTPDDSSENVLDNTPSKNLSTSIHEEDIIAEVSVSDIEGTPTGRRSPILDFKKPVKRAKEFSQTDSEDKDLTDNWSTPHPKLVKLSQPSPSGGPKANSRLKQLRLSLSKLNSVKIVDLTCSPDNDSPSVLKLIKKEHNENEDIIQPSPTSAAKQDFTALYKSFGDLKKSQSPSKFKKPILPKLSIVTNEENHVDPEDSFNLLQPFLKVIKTEECTEESVNVDETLCEDVSMETKQPKKGSCNIGIKLSPSKVPLGENKNYVNIPVDDSISLLPQNGEKVPQIPDKNIKSEKLEPIYKEPTVRKKAEKLALPGWSCQKCKNFYDVIYKDNPTMLSKLMAECSRHRGRNNPARPATPPGYWNPRWEVATDTETFNRQNNVS